MQQESVRVGVFDVRPQHEGGDVCAEAVGKKGAKLGVGCESCERGNGGRPGPLGLIVEGVSEGRVGTERDWVMRGQWGRGGRRRLSMNFATRAPMRL